MKRFLLFKGDFYYPSGGFGDFVGSYDTIEKAMEVPVSNFSSCGEIVDSHEWLVAAETKTTGKKGTFWEVVNRKIEK